MDGANGSGGSSWRELMDGTNGANGANGSGGSSWSITFDNTDGWADEQGFSDEHCGNVLHSGPCTHSHSLSTPLLLQTLVVSATTPKTGKQKPARGERDEIRGQFWP